MRLLEMMSLTPIMLCEILPVPSERIIKIFRVENAKGPGVFITPKHIYLLAEFSYHSARTFLSEYRVSILLDIETMDVEAKKFTQ